MKKEFGSQFYFFEFFGGEMEKNSCADRHSSFGGILSEVRIIKVENNLVVIGSLLVKKHPIRKLVLPSI